MSKEETTGLCKAKNATPQMTQAAKEANLALSGYDAGVLLGPACAETWGIPPRGTWQQNAWQVS